MPDMKRTRVLRLVLLGGGVAMVAGCGDQQPPDQTYRYACEQARAQKAPNADEICQRAASGSGTHRSSYGLPWLFGRTGNAYGRGYSSRGSGWSWFSGRSSSDAAFTSSSGSTSRGGFGSTASSFRSSGS
jgi:hypothetical protein